MSCPHCKASALSNAKFCRQCGRSLEINCPACSATNPPGSKFCGECGWKLPAIDIQSVVALKKPAEVCMTDLISQGERRHLTILFTDLTGYTRLLEKYDPEDIQPLMTDITHHCIRIIKAYNGHVERILGDEILGLFGLPVAHEDDAIRAIKAAREIHKTVTGMRPLSLSLEEPITMHTGINTGLVVTSRSSPGNGTFDLSGDSVNLASRLSDLARPNEILVGPETYRQAFGFFNFGAMSSIRIKGKSLPISVYAVKGERSRPMTGHRKVKLQSELIGRRDELKQLADAFAELENGKGAIISLVGEAGTGKSRLLYEFETRMAGKKINWITGYAFAHTQQVPFFPLIHMVRRWLKLDGTATEEQMRTGITRRVGDMLGPNAEEIPIIQGLIGQNVQETAGMSPEEWRKRLKLAMRDLLAAIARQAPTIFCTEDIHWADAASVSLFKDIIFNFPVPALLICTYRSHFTLFTSTELERVASIYKEIRISELSASETEEMISSMLNTATVPQNLSRLVRQRAEGNPFYLEEILNAMVESGALVQKAGRWQLNRAFKESDIPSTIYGVIAARMDQLSPQDKRILQEAAVIGRAFLYEILKHISVYSEVVDNGLHELEQAGLIHPSSLHPDMEFMFKHALIQEVSYCSMLRSERHRVHERVGLTMERIYKDRLSEFDETLAIHFQKSSATDKAVDYLIRSGTKALQRCALDESDQYFKKAKAMLEQTVSSDPEVKRRLLDVVNQWAFVFYYRGAYRELLELIEHQHRLVEGLDDPVLEGFHWGWYGWTLWHRHRFAEAYESLIRARDLAEQAGHPYLLGYAFSWLSWTGAELGRFDEAIEYCDRAENLYVSGKVCDPFIYFHPLTGKGYIYWHMGNARRTGEIGDRLIQFGNQHSYVRSLVMGHCCYGWKDLIIGNVQGAIACFKKAARVSADPWFSQFPRLALCYGAISNDQSKEALSLVEQLINFSDRNGAEYIGEPAYFFNDLINLAKGDIECGLKTMEKRLAEWKNENSRLRILTCGYIMAGVYAQLCRQSLEKPAESDAETIRRWSKKAFDWFKASIREADEMGAEALQGLAWLGLGKMYALSHCRPEARDALTRSIALLKKVEAEEHLKKACQVMSGLQER